MAQKQFLTLDGLTRYDELLKGVMSAEDAKAIKSISVSGNTVSFFKTNDASGTAAYTVNMPDTSSLMSKIASATGGKIVTSTANGEVAESGTAISDLATNAFVGSLPQGAESTTVVDYIGEAIEDATGDFITYNNQTSTGYIPVYDSNTNQIGASEFSNTDFSRISHATDGFDSDNTIADAIDTKMPLGDSWSGDKIAVTNSDGTVTEGISASYPNHETFVHGYFPAGTHGYVLITDDSVDQDDYRIINSSITNDELIDAVKATDGFDGNNTIADFIGSIPQGSSATDVIGYVDEQVDAVEDVADEKTVYIVDNGATSAYAKVYSIYQGSTGSAASPVAGEKLIDINIPKDQVVESGSVADITFHDNKLWDGATDVTALIKGTGTPTAADAGKYIKLILQNVTDPLYIAAQSLVDIYTAQPNATSVQLTISNTNEISAVIVDGAVTTAKIADGNVTKAKLAQGVQDSLDLADSAVQSVAEGATNGTVAVDGTDVAVHGLGSAAYTASTAYATSAQGALADTALQPGDLSEIPQASIEALFS